MSEEKAWRLLNKDGSFNIKAKTKRFSWHDPYHSLLSMGWIRFFGGVAAIWLFVNVVFALLYLSCGTQALDGMTATDSLGRFRETFFFSVQTLATIGYGHVSPHSLSANIVVTCEALVGMIGVAVVTGLVFAKFARPTAKIIFSDKALLTTIDGERVLMFRIANERLNQIAEATAGVILAINETTQEGEEYRNLYDLELERTKSPLFTMSWTVIHPIRPGSPLHTRSIEDLRKGEAEIFVTVTGLDDTFLTQVHARASYIPEDILSGKRYVDIITSDDDGLIGIDIDRLSDLEDELRA